MFRGTYLDFKEKADALNSKYHKLDKKFTFYIFLTLFKFYLNYFIKNKF
jgi:hypothetical protein